ncbi:MAG TPA: hypothetical protein VFV87_15015 [Pirellulaceae bacterium]|nr:hypothetical protein [Pirellulaceae bacterium]
MSSSGTNSSSTASPLEAAQKIVAILDGMTNEHRLLAVKFALETLGLQAPTAQVHEPQALQHPPQSVQAAATPPLRRMDIKTFTNMKAPKTDTQFTAVVAYFYQIESPEDQRKESINIETMKEAARLVGGRRQPPNWKFTLQNARNAGYLEAAGDGNYRLTPVGENLVAITLPGNAVAGGGNGAGKKKKSSKKAGKKATRKKAAKNR